MENNFVKTDRENFNSRGDTIMVEVYFSKNDPGFYAGNLQKVIYTALH